jgi:SAM-dependent methyltransferase
VTVAEALAAVRAGIAVREELAYYLVHQVRYSVILGRVAALAGGGRGRILDVGCYPYHVGRALELLGHGVQGIASEHDPLEGPHIRTLNVERDALPYETGTFDLVLFNEIIEHLVQSPVPALHELLRVTRPGGHLVMTTPNAASALKRALLLAGRNPSFSIEHYFENDGRGDVVYHRHNREYTLAEAKSVAVRCGWTMVEATRFISYTPFRERLAPESLPLRLAKLANFVCMKVAEPLRDTLLVVGAKPAD